MARVDADKIEERHFVNLFDEALNASKGMLSDTDIGNAIENAVESFKKDLGTSCSVKNFQTHEHLCAFFYRFSPLSAGLARRKTLAAIQNCNEFRLCLKQPSLKIISFGCGPGSDLVGLCSALYEEAELQELTLTLVDWNVRWEPFFQTVEHLLRGSNFGNASHLFQSAEITTKFIRSDILDGNNSYYQEHLEEANIVWMKGLLSILKNGAERYKAIKMVISSMLPGALLVVIDSPYYDNFSMFDNDLERVYCTEIKGYTFWQNPRTLYGRGLCRFSSQEMIVFIKKR